MKAFPDTNVLMSNPQELFNTYDEIIICGVVLDEIDKHKYSSDENKKYLARVVTRLIEENLDKVKFEIREGSFSLPLYLSKDSNDNRILSILSDLYVNDKDIIVLSNDLNFTQKCKLLSLPVKKLQQTEIEIYKGYKEVTLSDYELSIHYQCPVNKWDLLINEYLIIKNEQGEVVDKSRWTEKGFMSINAKPFKSVYFGDIKPKDVYQMLAIDSLNNTDLTVLFGMAGSGKTLYSLGWIMQNIQNNKVNKCVIVFNNVPLRNNQSQGFYPGTRNEKLLQSSLGGILSSKLGDMSMVETLINQGKLMLIPSCEIRGIEISNNDCIYVTEAQNMDAYTMRTIIQRAKEGCKIIIEGDLLEQQDIKHCGLKDNGMMRCIEVFKGSKYFSCVKLQRVYRSPIAEIANGI